MTNSIAEPVAAKDAAAERSAEKQETWAASRAFKKREEKNALAKHFAHHDFLVLEGTNPSSTRETAAVYLVIQGTSPKEVGQECLQWISEHAGQGPFHITWYSPGALLPAVLYEFRQRHPQLSAATHVHLFPGTIDLQLQAQVGLEAQEYARGIRRRFSCMILSGYSFDLRTGVVKFHFEREIPIQRTCALLEATQKFLFFDSEKFTGEGEAGYSLWELLATCTGVVLYTVTSTRSEAIKAAFATLGGRILTQDRSESDEAEEKSLRLTMVGVDGASSENFPIRGYLRRVVDPTLSVAALDRKVSV